ncbi:hypothetical protein B0O79_1652 [Flavobacteriaceae bacterium MAR_2009_75]|nr:hypothetical protein B0O79_1652 [Flavobacteriaceae bacterium MAR_2009_75]
MRKLIVLLTIPFLFMSACKEQKETSQMKEVMAIHDEVMPKMSKLGDLVGELNSKENDSTEIGKKYKQARKDLQVAHKSMMDWMQNFGNRFGPDEILNGKELSEQKKQWLDEEEEKIKEVKEHINKSIDNANSLLGRDNE